MLARLGRHDEAADDAAAGAGVRRPARRPRAWPRPPPTTAGLVALAAGRYAEAADLLGGRSTAGADVSRVAAGLTRAEALALAGDPDGGHRPAARPRCSSRSAGPTSPGRWCRGSPGCRPWSRTPAGDRAVDPPRLDECRPRPGAACSDTAEDDAGEGYLASLVDLGRPPIVGLVEPARELARIDAAVLAAAPSDPEPAAR